MFITPSFKKSLMVEQFQGNYLKAALSSLDRHKSTSHSLGEGGGAGGGEGVS